MRSYLQRKLNNTSLETLKIKDYLFVEEIDGNLVAKRSSKELANARVLGIDTIDGRFTAHWLSNWNTSGDFSSEIMLFNTDCKLDRDDLDKKNAYRIHNGLMPIK